MLRRMSALESRPAQRVLDLGAGVGWLSARLAAAGHRPLAVDLSTHPAHGLGVLGRFAPAVPAVRADFDHLPLPDGACSLAIFNASFHYSPDPVVTLTEAARVVAPGGAIAVLDTPIYGRREAGEAMVAARKRAFVARYGFASDAHGGCEYLIWRDLADLAATVGLQWRARRPWYGWRYALRPLRTLVGARPPSTFAVVLFAVPAAAPA
jgi:SAM-dependent methyltransferase